MTKPQPTFPLNAWYAAAYDVELGRQLLARTLCDQKLVLYRKLDGQAVALEDACWHRLLPLSLGRLQDDQVVCGYHGLVFNALGQCTRMPSQATLNPSACVRSYPVVERHRFVWVWPGDPTLADPNLVPDMHWNQHPDWAADGKRLSVACDYRLVLDNLMDLTHETFVHGSSIGNDSLLEAPFLATHGDRTATVTRWMSGIEAPPFWAGQIKAELGYSGPVDRWQIVRFEAPCTVTIDVGVAQSGTGAVPPGGNQGDPSLGDRSRGVNGYVLNTISPETATSCHYFWAFARNYRVPAQSLTHQLREGVAGIFREDEKILEAQQLAISAHPERQFHNLNIDAGALWARRLIQRLIDLERPCSETWPHSAV
jgi:vanillate O-demethylase monooxygenase subunit